MYTLMAVAVIGMIAASLWVLGFLFDRVCFLQRGKGGWGLRASYTIECHNYCIYLTQ